MCIECYELLGFDFLGLGSFQQDLSIVVSFSMAECGVWLACLSCL